jgi:hypothetical protein
MESKHEVVEQLKINARIHELMKEGKQKRPHVWDMNVIVDTICEEFGEQHRLVVRKYILDYCNL